MLELVFIIGGAFAFLLLLKYLAGKSADTWKNLRAGLVGFGFFWVSADAPSADWTWSYNIVSGTFAVSDGTKVNVSGASGTGRQITKTWGSAWTIRLVNDSGQVINAPRLNWYAEGQATYTSAGGPALSGSTTGEQSWGNVLTVPGGAMSVGEEREVTLSGISGAFGLTISELSGSGFHYPRAPGGASIGTHTFGIAGKLYDNDGTPSAASATWGLFEVEVTGTNNSTGTSVATVTPTGNPVLGWSGTTDLVDLNVDFTLYNTSGEDVIWQIISYVDSVPTVLDEFGQSAGSPVIEHAETYSVYETAENVLVASVEPMSVYAGSPTHSVGTDGEDWEGTFDVGEPLLFNVRFSFRNTTGEPAQVSVSLPGGVAIGTLDVADGESELDFEVPAPEGVVLEVTSLTEDVTCVAPEGWVDTPLTLGVLNVYRRFLHDSSGSPPDPSVYSAKGYDAEGNEIVGWVEMHDEGDGISTAVSPTANEFRPGGTLENPSAATGTQVTGSTSVIGGNIGGLLGRGPGAGVGDTGAIGDGLADGAAAGEAATEGLGEMVDGLGDWFEGLAPAETFFGVTPATEWVINIPDSGVWPGFTTTIDLTAFWVGFLRSLILFAASFQAVRACIAIIV